MMDTLETFFFWETFTSIALLAAIAIGIGLSGKLILETIKNLFEKSRKQRSVAGTLNAMNGEGGFRNDVIAKFVEVQNSTDFGTFSGYSTHLVDYVLEQLKVLFTVESVMQLCGINKRYCNQILKVTDSEGNNIFIGLSWATKELFDEQGRLQFTCDVPVMEYSFLEEDENVVVGSNTLEIVYPIGITDKHATMVAIQNILKEAEMTPVVHNTKSANTVVSYRLRNYRGMGYMLEPHRSELVRMSPEMLDASYNEVSYDFQGTVYSFSMSKAFPVMGESLALNENILLFGAPGVGKTALMEQLQARLSHRNGMRCIWITPNQLTELQKSTEAQTALVNALRSEKEEKKTIFFIDEGETLLRKGDGIHSEMNAFMLSLLSGNLQKDFNCQVVIAFNADPTVLDTALFRKGRAGMVINLSPISAEKANQLIQLIRKNNTDRVFDKAQYTKLLKANNTGVTGQVYAKPGFITLADLYSTLVFQGRHAALMRAISQATGKEVVEKSPVPVQPTEIPAEAPVAPRRAPGPKLPPAEALPSEARKKKWRVRK